MATLESIQNELESQRALVAEFNKTNEEKLNAKADGKSVVDLQVKLDNLNSAMADQAAKLDTLQQELSEKSVNVATASVQKEIKNFADYIKSGIRNEVKTGTSGNGGYAVPETLDSQLEKLAPKASALANLVTIKNVGAGYHKIVDLKGTAVANSVELQIIDQTATSTIAKISPVWGKIEAKPYMSREALEDIFFQADAWVLESVNDAIGDKLETDMISGAGSSGATKGMLAYTMSTDPDSSRTFGQFQYISSGSSGAFPSTNPGDGIDKLIDLQSALKSGYQANATWLVNNATKSALRKMKDSNGNYYWQPAVIAGAPEMFLGKPLVVSDAMPGVGTADAFAVAYGDFARALHLCFAGSTIIIRDELTHAPNIQFLISKRYGLMVNNSEAIKFLKLSA